MIREPSACSISSSRVYAVPSVVMAAWKVPSLLTGSSSGAVRASSKSRTVTVISVQSLSRLVTPSPRVRTARVYSPAAGKPASISL